MHCTINEEAAKIINEILQSEEAKGKTLRVIVAHKHHDHAHYQLGLDVANEFDEIVETSTGINVLLDTREDFLDGVSIQYLYQPSEGFAVTNPSKGNHGGHA